MVFVDVKVKAETPPPKKTKYKKCPMSCRFPPVVIGLSSCGDEAGGCDEGKIAAGFGVTLPALLAGTRHVIFHQKVSLNLCIFAMSVGTKKDDLTR